MNKEPHFMTGEENRRLFGGHKIIRKSEQEIRKDERRKVLKELKNKLKAERKEIAWGYDVSHG